MPCNIDLKLVFQKSYFCVLLLLEIHHTNKWLNDLIVFALGGMFEQFQGILGNLQKDRKLPVGRGYAPPGGIV